MTKRRDTAIVMAIPELTRDFRLFVFLDPDASVIEVAQYAWDPDEEQPQSTTT